MMTFMSIFSNQRSQRRIQFRAGFFSAANVFSMSRPAFSIRSCSAATAVLNILLTESMTMVLKGCLVVASVMISSVTAAKSLAPWSGPKYMPPLFFNRSVYCGRLAPPSQSIR